MDIIHKGILRDIRARNRSLTLERVFTNNKEESQEANDTATTTIRNHFRPFISKNVIVIRISDSCFKSDLIEENLKIMTKERQKMKKATISY